MKLYSMTATFGKLEHETLTLEPGLNVIYAPNEWGKSTWCAFLMAMLYGMDTREKSTKNSLAEKERFAPWSGRPMAGRIDLNWKGRDITIERSTVGRIPLGQFQAYETATGLPVSELNASNCGQMLLGVEQSVFRRAGFIRLTDLPVTQDEALRRRLNDLVTTGDESGDGSRLEEGLQELKNRCRTNRRTGLLPQAEARRASIDDALEELNNLTVQQTAIKEKLQMNEAYQAQLENHLSAMEFIQAQEDQFHVNEAETVLREAEAALDTLEKHCRDLPEEADMRAQLEALEALRQKIAFANDSMDQLPPVPDPPVVPAPFRGLDKPAILKQVYYDTKRMEEASSKLPLLLLCLGIGLLLGGTAFLRHQLVISLLMLAAGLVFGIWGCLKWRQQSNDYNQLSEKYGSALPSLWQDTVDQYVQDYNWHRSILQTHQEKQEAQRALLDALQLEYTRLCAGRSLDDQLAALQQNLQLLNTRAAAEQRVQNARAQYETVRAMARSAPAPHQPDSLTTSPEETRQLLQEAKTEHQYLVNRAGIFAGRMEAIGNPETLKAERESLNRQIKKLEDTYAALCLAQKTLTDASAQLQRRFSPRITRRAQLLFSGMTQGRYDRVALGENFGLQSATQQEDTLHDILWRSDGTIDQLYLSLRLAVAEELTPDTPLILDDALVRFDDERLQAAMDILSQLARTKQVILFSCQKRETKLLEKKH